MACNQQTRRSNDVGNVACGEPAFEHGHRGSYLTPPRLVDGRNSRAVGSFTPHTLPFGLYPGSSATCSPKLPRVGGLPAEMTYAKGSSSSLGGGVSKAGASDTLAFFPSTAFTCATLAFIIAEKLRS